MRKNDAGAWDVFVCFDIYRSVFSNSCEIPMDISEILTWVLPQPLTPSHIPYANKWTSNKAAQNFRNLVSHMWLIPVLKFSFRICFVAIMVTQILMAALWAKTGVLISPFKASLAQECFAGKNLSKKSFRTSFHKLERNEWRTCLLGFTQTGPFFTCQTRYSHARNLIDVQIWGYFKNTYFSNLPTLF